jgi:hypothetical protein
MAFHFLYCYLFVSKDLKRKFDRLSDDYDATLSKYMTKKSKDPGINEVISVHLWKMKYRLSLIFIWQFHNQ